MTTEASFEGRYWQLVHKNNQDGGRVTCTVYVVERVINLQHMTLGFIDNFTK